MTTPARPAWRELRLALKHFQRFCASYIPGDVPAPGRPILLSTREVYSMAGSRFEFDVAAPALATPEDVVGLKLYTSLDGVESTPVDVPIGGTTTVSGAQGQVMILEFSAVDESGNESDHGQPLEFTVTDTVPPSVPGAPVVMATREVFDAAPPDVPPPDVPAPEPTPDVPPTDVPPTDVPPTDVPPTDVPPTDVPPTDVPPPDDGTTPPPAPAP